MEPLADSGQKLVLTAERDGAEVVLKLLKPTADIAERVRREIEASRLLDCSYIPRVLDFGERAIAGRTTVYLMEEMVRGRTYREILNAEPKRELNEVLRIGQDLLSACQDFEAAGLVHRDLKPANLILEDTGKLWVIDFGIVRFLDRMSLTQTAHGMGLFTPGYGAPEQRNNLKPQIDVRADLFSTGMIMYEALLGENPYVTGARDALEVVSRMESTDLAPLAGMDSTVDSGLSDFIASLTARFPSRRPQSAGDALDWFQVVKERIDKNS